MKWVRFARALWPYAVRLVRSLYDAFGGDIPRAQEALRRITNHWREWDGEKARQADELERAISGRVPERKP